MKIGALGSPGDALLFCPNCLLFAAPINVGDGLIECRGCRARLAVFHEGSAEKLAPAGRQPASEPRKEARAPEARRKPQQATLPKPAPAPPPPAKPAATPAERSGDVEDMPDVW